MFVYKSMGDILLEKVDVFGIIAVSRGNVNIMIEH